MLERRRGLPIALATLTLAVARRAGAPMAGIGMPGHFVVAELARGEPEYLDPFDRWERRSVADLAAIVRRTSGLEMRPEFLAPADDRAILARTLANLRGSYLRRRRLRDALWTIELGLLVRRATPASRAGRSGSSPAPAATPRPRSGRPRSSRPTRGTPRRGRSRPGSTPPAT